MRSQHCMSKNNYTQYSCCNDENNTIRLIDCQFQLSPHMLSILINIGRPYYNMNTVLHIRLRNDAMTVRREADAYFSYTERQRRRRNYRCRSWINRSQNVNGLRARVLITSTGNRSDTVHPQCSSFVCLYVRNACGQHKQESLLRDAISLLLLV